MIALDRTISRLQIHSGGFWTNSEMLRVVICSCRFDAEIVSLGEFRRFLKFDYIHPRRYCSTPLCAAWKLDSIRKVFELDPKVAKLCSQELTESVLVLSGIRNV